MGHRASYAVLEGGQLRLFYSHWGALSVPEDVFWGPAYVEAYIESLEEVDFWQDDVFGEGGIGLNKDDQVLTYFGCDTLAWGEVAELFNEIVQAWWASFGWTARCVQGTPDIAESVGEPRSVAEATPIDPVPYDPNDLGRYWEEDRRVSTLVSVDGKHVCADVGVTPFLMAGTSVLEHCERLPTLDDVRAHHEQRPLTEWEAEAGRKAPLINEFYAGIAIWPSEKRIDVFAEWMSDPDLEFIRAKVWAGWSISKHDEGMAGHFERLGVDGPADLLEPKWWGSDSEEQTQPTEADLLNEIREQLLGERADPTVFMSKVIEDTMKDSEDVWVNPHAMVSPTDPRPAPGECEAIFDRAIAAWARSRRNKA